MDAKERVARLGELKLELVKANVAAKKSGSKTKEIKKAIARILTFDGAAKKRLLGGRK
mgnify:CR=1 FL=1